MNKQTRIEAGQTGFPAKAGEARLPFTAPVLREIEPGTPEHARIKAALEARQVNR